MLKKFWIFVAIVVALIALWTLFTLTWSYSAGERAGYVQKFSEKGWICKTWEGEMAMVTMPGTVAEKFFFTVHDDALALKLSRAMGKRVSLHYEEKVGLPTSCFGETRYFVNEFVETADIPLGPGVVLPTTPGASAAK